MIRNIINATASPITLSDLNGITIDPGESIDGLQFGIVPFKASSTLIQALLNGSLQLHDGVTLYEGSRAVDLLKDVVDQLTKDGKRIITASDRPKDHYRHFTSHGDDLTTGVRGDGAALIFQVPASQTVVVDVQFVDDTYLKDGSIIYENAELGSHISVDIVAPPGVPYPAIFKNGNYDMVDGSLVPNLTNTGSLFMDSQSETTFLRFMNKMLILGSHQAEFLAPEPSFLPATVIHRLKVYNASTTQDLNAVAGLGMYRRETV